MYRGLDFADESPLTGTPAFILALFVFIGMIFVVLVRVFLIVGCLLEEMKMIAHMVWLVLHRIMGMAAESQCSQCELADDE